jgi:phosphoribosylamine--glycine ligase
VVLPLLESDLLDIMMATRNGTLEETPVEFKNAHACCVIMASKGYPESYEKGFEITVDKTVKEHVYMAGAAIKDGKTVTAGGRVLGVTAVEENLPKAIEKAYEMVEKIHFEGAFYRRDIGKKALEKA